MTEETKRKTHDISRYIDFGPDMPRGRSIKSIVNKAVTVTKWAVKNGRYGLYASMNVIVDEMEFIVNSDRRDIMRQLETIRKKQEEMGETGQAFDCIPRRNGDRIVLCPCNRRAWGR